MVGQKKSFFLILSIIYKFIFSSGQRESSDFHKQLKTDSVSTSKYEVVNFNNNQNVVIKFIIQCGKYNTKDK